MVLRLILKLLLPLAAVPLLTGCGTIPAAADDGQSVRDAGPAHPGANSYIVVDASDGRVLLARNADQRRSVASLTKIATTAVVLEFLAKSGGSLDEMLVVPPSVQVLGVPSPVGLKPGDAISTRDAIYCAMMASDNYAAETLAAHFGAKLAAAGLGGAPMQAFVTQMNGLASRIGMRNTRFANPHGLDLPNARGYSSAADVARLSLYALKIPGFTYYSSQKTRRVTVRTAAGPQTYTVRNTNELIGRGRIDAGKTGTTNLAGPCLMVTEPKPSTVIPRADGSTVVIPNRLVVVVLGAPDRFELTWRLLQDGWEVYNRWRASGSPAGEPGTSLSPLPDPAIAR